MDGCENHHPPITINPVSTKSGAVQYLPNRRSLTAGGRLTRHQEAHGVSLTQPALAHAQPHPSLFSLSHFRGALHSQCTGNRFSSLVNPQDDSEEVMRPPIPRLDIVYVGTLPPHPGGSAISGDQIIRGLASRGHTVRAVAPITPEGVRWTERRDADPSGVTVRRFQVPEFYLTPTTPASDDYRRLEEKAVQAVLTTVLAGRRPDLLLVGRELYAPVVADIASNWRLPYVLRLPGGTTHGLLGGSYPDDLRSRLLAAYRGAALVISPSRQLAALVRAQHVERTIVIPTAIDLEAFAPRQKDARLLRELGIDALGPVIAHIAVLRPVKRTLDLIRSAVEVTRHRPHVTYLVVGDGPLRSDLEAVCQRTGIANRFRFTGWVEYSAMPRYVNLADVVVVPSEVEGLARVYVEAQAAGRAVLASDIEPAREVIEDGETGLLFRMGDIADLVAKTARLVEDAPLRAALGRRAREHLGPHALERALDAYETGLVEVLRR